MPDFPGTSCDPSSSPRRGFGEVSELLKDLCERRPEFLLLRVEETRPLAHGDGLELLFCKRSRGKGVIESDGALKELPGDLLI